jgi:hypothetical protein
MWSRSRCGIFDISAILAIIVGWWDRRGDVGATETEIIRIDH